MVTDPNNHLYSKKKKKSQLNPKNKMLLWPSEVIHCVARYTEVKQNNSRGSSIPNVSLLPLKFHVYNACVVHYKPNGERFGSQWKVLTGMKIGGFFFPTS